MGEGLPTGALDGHEGVGGLVRSGVERLSTGGGRGGDVLHLRVQVLVEVPGDAGAVGLDGKVGVALPLLVQLHRPGPQRFDRDVAAVQEVTGAQEGERDGDEEDGVY